MHEKRAYLRIRTQHTSDKKEDCHFPRNSTLYFITITTFLPFWIFPPNPLISNTNKTQYLKYNSTAMSLTPLYPHGPTFRLKAVVGNRQEDVTELEERENQRLLAALVASLDMKVCLAYTELFVSEPRPTLMLCFYFAATSSSF